MLAGSTCLKAQGWGCSVNALGMCVSMREAGEQEAEESGWRDGEREVGGVERRRWEGERRGWPVWRAGTTSHNTSLRRDT